MDYTIIIPAIMVVVGIIITSARLPGIKMPWSILIGGGLIVIAVAIYVFTRGPNWLLGGG